MKSNLAQQPSNNNSDFLVGDVVVYMNHIEINDLKTVEVFQPSEFYWLEGGQIVHWSDIRHATADELNAGQRLNNTQTKELPILFNAEMVTAILDGRKNQTRRVLKIQPTICHDDRGGHWWPCDAVQSMIHIEKELQDYEGVYAGLIDDCNPFGAKGDHLWVRETFMDLSGTGVEHRDSKGKLQKYAYAADCPRGSHSDETRKEFGLKWKPSIHMPRSANRILLEITNIRVERLTDISTEDALAEGINHKTMNCPKHEFFQLWNSIYGDLAHEKNPWVWVVEFKMIQGGAY